jgi:hypothetical protein
MPHRGRPQIYASKEDRDTARRLQRRIRYDRRKKKSAQHGKEFRNFISNGMYFYNFVKARSASFCTDVADFS